MDKKWIKNNLCHPGVLASWALIALAASSSWVGLTILFLAVPVLRKVILSQRAEAFQDGDAAGSSRVIWKNMARSKDLTERQNAESYFDQ